MGDHLVANIERRALWLELLKAINTSVPSLDPQEKLPKEIKDRKEMHIDFIDCQRLEDTSKWWEKVKEYYWDLSGQATAAPTGSAAPAAPSPGGGPAARRNTSPAQPSNQGPTAKVGSFASKATITSTMRASMRGLTSFAIPWSKTLPATRSNYPWVTR